MMSPNWLDIAAGSLVGIVICWAFWFVYGIFYKKDTKSVPEVEEFSVTAGCEDYVQHLSVNDILGMNP